MKLYEGMFVIEAGRAAREWEGTVTTVHSVLEKHGATVRQGFRFDERKLAYPIDGVRRGVYLISYFDADPESIADMRVDLNLSEAVLRYMILRYEGMTEVPEAPSLGTATAVPADYVEPKPEEKPAEEPKAEEKPAEEPKAEEKPAEEPKAEEKPAEEPKAEEKPAEEPKAEEKPAEEPKAEEAPAEAPAEEAAPAAEETPAEEAPATEETLAETPTEEKAEPAEAEAAAEPAPAETDEEKKEEA
jgi:ribosomal protein S6